MRCLNSLSWKIVFKIYFLFSAVYNRSSKTVIEINKKNFICRSTKYTPSFNLKLAETDMKACEASEMYINASLHFRTSWRFNLREKIRFAAIYLQQVSKKSHTLIQAPASQPYRMHSAQYYCTEKTHWHLILWRETLKAHLPRK